MPGYSHRVTNGASGSSQGRGHADSDKRPANNIWVIAVGTVLAIVIGVALFASLINLWPAVDNATTTGASAAKSTEYHVRLFFATVKVTVNSSTALLLLVIIVGALGSLIHAATSFADFVGNRRFYSSWIVWYLMRLVVGSALAVLLYFAFRGGFFSGSAQSTAVNPYGLAALAGLAGLFSKQATDKLREVFTTLFRVQAGEGDGQRKDDLANPVPVLTRVDPKSINVGEPNPKFIIYGDHFIDGATTVSVNGITLKPTIVSAQELEVTPSAEMVSKEQFLTITVANGEPGGGQAPAVLTVVVVKPPE